MFQDMTKQMSRSMEPMKTLVEIQAKMLEQLTRQQIACAQSCVEATMEQSKELSACKTPEDLLKLQQAYAKGLEDTLQKASAANMDALNEAREQMEKLTREAFDSLTPKR
ncbi:phasin family protein [Motiliproteus sp. SC1-56]|uniref:phasin family protein n=1 Tax=Motiliproteus sp. SC1-56 TaxID=2799565 RepID=UPI001A8CCC9F|nr:phasin family protein [Motiliproteus sp. SC1-56]